MDLTDKLCLNLLHSEHSCLLVVSVISKIVCSRMYNEKELNRIQVCMKAVATRGVMTP